MSKKIKSSIKFVRALLTNFLTANTTISILIWKLNKTLKQENMPPRGRRPLGTSSSSDLVLVWRGSSPSVAGDNSWLWVVPPENRVISQYIVLEASPGLLDLIPWIQGLLGTFGTFMVTSRKAHKSPRSWLGRIDLIWQEFESTMSPTFGIPKLLLYPSVGRTGASGLRCGQFEL
jgi:hypothetical protein